ncbi:hypothetical protein [Brevibacterium daeguense]|uniref:hypothetical protein n=1 Tax=Brevibacterium daeguense TaxID=909936 RepID=UPI001F381423|nr:hypothetical protein [Brevibacterium daeguense]
MGDRDRPTGRPRLSGASLIVRDEYPDAASFDLSEEAEGNKLYYLLHGRDRRRVHLADQEHRQQDRHQENG